MIFVNHSWFFPALVPAEMPIGLSHKELDFCWCDPIIEVDENGREGFPTHFALRASYGFPMRSLERESPRKGISRVPVA